MASTSPWVKRMMRAGLEDVADFGFSGTVEWRIYGHAGLHQTVCEVLKQSDDGLDRRAREALETYWERVELWIDEPGAGDAEAFLRQRSNHEGREKHHPNSRDTLSVPRHKRARTSNPGRI